ncbi:HAD-IC family P-type ATPase [Roseburia inulinivorans]
MCQNMSGLSTAEVEFRKKAGLSNESVDSSTKTVAQIIRSNVVTYYNLIFLIITILLIVVGSFRDLTFLPIIIANMLIGIIQELRSKKILDDLTILNTPKITVRRNGSDQEVLADELVQDDVITLSAGGQIPADALVLSGNITVNEALITGEADEIVKKEGDSLFSGSFVISGECMAKLEKVGKDSYISGLMLQATQTKEGEQSEMIRALNRLVQTVGVIILPIGAILFLQQYFFSGATMKDSVTGMVAAILGMIPEGLYLLASVAMVVSVMRLGKQKVLIHDMKCIETLARVNVLCVDKTGTITVPEMEVAQFILAKDQSLAAKEKEQEADQQSEYRNQTAEEEKNKVARLLSDCVRALPCDNATMEALQQYFTEPMENSAEKIVPFSSATKYSGVVLAGKAYVVGAPEFVLRQDYAAVRGTIEVFLEKGYRVLVFAEYEGNLDGKELTENADPIAFILLNNAIREGAMDTFRYFSKRGVEVKVISGDNPVTVSEIAKKAGIRHAEKQVDAETLKTVDAVRKAAKKYTVFGRVTPEQKRLLVQTLKEQGKTVAMTGDGVNDILALKDADCSIAMASGSEAASQVAQLVLLDNDFNKMPSVVMEGRRVVNNIGRTASLYLVKNIFSMLLAVFSMLFLIDYPLEPSQVSLISVFTIGIPSFFLALEQNRNQIHGHFLTNVLIQALPAGITDFIVVSGLVIFCREFGVEKECVSTSCTILIAVVGFMILYHIAKPMTTPHAILIAAMVIGWLFCMLFFSELFAITAVTGKCAMLMIVFAVITEPVFRYLIQLVEAVQKWGRKLKF